MTDVHGSIVLEARQSAGVFAHTLHCRLKLAWRAPQNSQPYGYAAALGTAFLFLQRHTFTTAGCLRRARALASRRAVSAAASISAGLAPASAMLRLSRIHMLTTGSAGPVVHDAASFRSYVSCLPLFGRILILAYMLWRQ